MSERNPDRLGKVWDADLRAEMRDLAYRIMDCFAHVDDPEFPDGVTATWFGDELLVTAKGESARQIAAFCIAADIADPEHAPER